MTSIVNPCHYILFVCDNIFACDRYIDCIYCAQFEDLRNETNYETGKKICLKLFLLVMITLLINLLQVPGAAQKPSI